MVRPATLVAALSGGADTGAVLRAALGFAHLVGTTVEALHVTEDGEPTGDPGREAHVAGVVLHHRHGVVADQILGALASPRVFGAAMGSRRGRAGPCSAGTTALGVLGATAKPVLYVPPEAAVAGAFAPRRLVVPLDGSTAVSSTYLAVERHFQPDAEREVVVLYVLDGLTPRMLDRPEYDLSTWGDEFVLRYCPGEHRTFEWRRGDPVRAVVEVADQVGSDLIVLGRGANGGAGHDHVIHGVLARSVIPVLVIPTPDDAAPGSPATRVRRSKSRR